MKSPQNSETQPLLRKTPQRNPQMPSLDTSFKESISDLNASSALAFSASRQASAKTSSPHSAKQNEFYRKESSSHDSESEQESETSFTLDSFNRNNIDLDSIATHITNFVTNSPSLLPRHLKSNNPKRVLFYSKQTGAIRARKLEQLDFSAAFTEKSLPQNSAQSSLSPSPVGSVQTTDLKLIAIPKKESKLNVLTILQSGTFWLNVINPSKSEIQNYSHLFGIHPLTGQDILSEETREKAESFPNYLYLSIKTFDSDPYSNYYLAPINLSIVIFSECVLSFQARPIPHIDNVLKRIHQLKAFNKVNLTSEWISYALGMCNLNSVDDVTDSFLPLLKYVEHEVESIDDLVLLLSSTEQSDMLRRICLARKTVLTLLKLSTNKPSLLKIVVKLFSESQDYSISLYLADIQDHLISLVQSLNHAEKSLTRSHANYLAGISIEITQASNKTNDVVMKMTALAGFLQS